MYMVRKVYTNESPMQTSTKKKSRKRKLTSSTKVPARPQTSNLTLKGNSGYSDKRVDLSTKPGTFIDE